MKKIVIGSTERHMGKTTLARRLQQVIPKSIVLKIGHHEDKQKLEPLFHSPEELLDTLKKYEQDYDVVIIESNAILRHIKPDLAVFIKGKENPMKVSAVFASTMADIIIDESVALALEDVFEKLSTLFVDEASQQPMADCAKVLVQFQTEFHLRFQHTGG